MSDAGSGITLALRPHPDFPGEAVAKLEVAARRDDATLMLAYRLTGSAERLVVPPPAEPLRTDGLWRTTCFEAFVRAAGGEAYFEFNLSPSGAWAAYQFDGYRSGMAPLEIAAPRTEFRLTHAGCELRTTLELPAHGAVGLALSAVIEEQGGRKSYWALAHAGERPDFHNFVGVPLPAADEDD